MSESLVVCCCWTPSNMEVGKVSRMASVCIKILPAFTSNLTLKWTKVNQDLLTPQVKNLSSTAVQQLKEIKHTVDGNRIIVEGVHVESDRTGQVIELDGPPTSCSLCRLNLDLQHTDVLILGQFIRPNGQVFSRRVTGLCEKQQKLVASLVDQAKKAGLLPSKFKAFGWRKFNRYFVPEKSGRKTKVYM